MRKFTLKNPFIILASWVILWIVSTSIILVILSQQASEGYIVKKDCVIYKEDVCLLYSAEYKVPLSEELIIQSVGAAILIGAVVIGTGYISMKVR